MKALLDKLEDLVREMREASEAPMDMKPGFLKNTTITLRGTYVDENGEESNVNQEFEATACSWQMSREPGLYQMGGGEWAGPKKTTHTLTWKGWEK